ncbi:MULTISPECIES: hypothetical protein [Pseudomonas]|uniref:Uncharacterized protein n=1 Tax=Pseudomonas sichuanensis TaxID=2213015 RepID=A0ABV0DH50_9PSED
MTWNDREKALMAWRELFTTSVVRMDAAEQYEELVRLADNYQRGGLISEEERSALIFEATDRYASLVVGAGEVCRSRQGVKSLQLPPSVIERQAIRAIRLLPGNQISQRLCKS